MEAGVAHEVAGDTVTRGRRVARRRTWRASGAARRHAGVRGASRATLVISAAAHEAAHAAGARGRASGDGWAGAGTRPAVQRVGPEVRTRAAAHVPAGLAPRLAGGAIARQVRLADGREPRALKAARSAVRVPCQIRLTAVRREPVAALEAVVASDAARDAVTGRHCVRGGRARRARTSARRDGEVRHAGTAAQVKASVAREVTRVARGPGHARGCGIRRDRARRARGTAVGRVRRADAGASAQVRGRVAGESAHVCDARRGCHRRRRAIRRAAAAVTRIGFSGNLAPVGHRAVAVSKARIARHATDPVDACCCAVWRGRAGAAAGAAVGVVCQQARLASVRRDSVAIAPPRVAGDRTRSAAARRGCVWAARARRARRAARHWRAIRDAGRTALVHTGRALDATDVASVAVRVADVRTVRSGIDRPPVAVSIDRHIRMTEALPVERAPGDHGREKRGVYDRREATHDGSTPAVERTGPMGRATHSIGLTQVPSICNMRPAVRACSAVDSGENLTDRPPVAGSDSASEARVHM